MGKRIRLQIVRWMMIFVYFAHYYLLLSVLVPYAKLYTTSTIKTHFCFCVDSDAGACSTEIFCSGAKVSYLLCVFSHFSTFLQIVTSEIKKEINIQVRKWSNFGFKRG